MLSSKNLQKGLGIVLLAAIIVSLASAGPDRRRQSNERGGDRGGDRQGQRDRSFDRSDMEERMMTMMQERLGISDEEWTVIKPLMSEVMTQSRAASGRSGMMRNRGGRGRDRGNDSQQQELSEDASAVEKAVYELQQTLEKEAPSSAEIKAKLTALRGAKEKAKQDLVKAQQKLREVLTLKQEAQLVMIGMLD